MNGQNVTEAKQLQNLRMGILRCSVHSGYAVRSKNQLVAAWLCLLVRGRSNFMAAGDFAARRAGLAQHRNVRACKMTPNWQKWNHEIQHCILHVHLNAVLFKLSARVYLCKSQNAATEPEMKPDTMISEMVQRSALTVLGTPYLGTTPTPEVVAAFREVGNSIGARFRWRF